MSTYNDLVSVSFEDAVTYSDTQDADILGIIMPYHWGPAGSVNVFTKNEFYNAYPEIVPDYTAVKVTAPTDALYGPYYQVKSYFNNGGSYVAVYRPLDNSHIFGDPTSASTGKFGLKYPGLPCDLPSTSINPGIIYDSTAGTVTFYGDVTSATTMADTIIEQFEGQIDNPSGTDSETGESTYLPYILNQKATYLKSYIDSTTITPVAFADYTAVAPASTETYDAVFATSEELVPTQFPIAVGKESEFSELLKYFTVTFYREIADPTASSQATPDRFIIDVAGKESVTVFNASHEIYCNVGVAGAYAKVAASAHLNQIASARAYGSYNGTVTTGYQFTAITGFMDKGIVTVYNAAQGPQIFGVRNSYNRSKPSSYFARANVSRVLASVLRDVKSACYDVIHTDTASNETSRTAFEANLNNIINSYIATQDLASDSKAICNASNNSDAQTQGGKILNIILSMHFYGLVEKVNIRVVATDSSVSVNFA